ncbi:hypothetical protein [Bacillus weihaiensis]|uniref:hypothetical protein n=1 Tax=Bacillus weihaiensis TaxID=1547283 RepID=UPI0023526012|nr:hypothetical protein [Bacillus weihaiensis]
MELWVRVLKPFGYYTDHQKGDELTIPLADVNELIKQDFVELIVNNYNNNLPYDETGDDDCNVLEELF